MAVSWGSVTGVLGGGQRIPPHSQSNLMSLGSSRSWDDPEPTNDVLSAVLTQEATTSLDDLGKSLNLLPQFLFYPMGILVHCWEYEYFIHCLTQVVLLCVYAYNTCTFILILYLIHN